MIQKIYVIKSNLAISLAGSVFEMKQFLEETKNYFKYKDVSVENVKDFVSNCIAPLNLTDCVFCIALMEPDGIFQLFDAAIGRGKWLKGKSPIFGTIKSTASGAEDFITIANRADLTTVHSHMDEKHEVAKVLHAHLTFFGQLISTELLTLETVSKFWGINYELIVYDVNRFIKVDDISHLILKMKIDINEVSGNIGLLYLYHSRYYEDLLSISVFDFQKNQLAGYIIPPLDKINSNIDLGFLPKEFVLYTTKVCITFLIEFSNGKKYSHYAYIYSNPTDPNDRPSVELEFKSDYTYRFYLGEKFMRPIVENAIAWQERN